mmetsp:Transcript_67028/g.145717  ORF Transcript_67028/g.145717 Transcript_67028/m.145717 type:complete len:96 (-) Transcript_67028:8-295(-)
MSTKAESQRAGLKVLAAKPPATSEPAAKATGRGCFAKTWAPRAPNLRKGRAAARNAMVMTTMEDIEREREKNKTMKKNKQKNEKKKLAFEQESTA